MSFSIQKTQSILVALVFVFGLPNFLHAEKVDFEKEIKPIFQEHCWDCHSGDEPDSGLNLERRVKALKGGDYGQPSIVPNKPEKSFLVDVINHKDPDLKMPPDQEKLPKKTIDLLTRWISEGANWPGQMDDKLDAKKSDHWSFQPVVRPEIPNKANPNPIDAFLVQKLKEKNLSYSNPADARSLIRRASFVLTGLSPTPKETDNFAAAYSENRDAAYEELIDRLLASPHFGERWAQHWLDVIRWAETSGSESNLYRKNAWIYRDYVIRAFNDDKPYDQFLYEQIAGDTTGNGEAIGYLVSGPHVPIATVGQEPSARRQARADRMDEILQTVGASSLGMTIGCARCHNHKFDPISIQDYYALSAVFQDVEFGSRYPELEDDHPIKLRGKELYRAINKERNILRKTGPWEEDWRSHKELFFPPQKTKSVRISFKRTFIRLDEVQIFEASSNNNNLALDSKGTQVSVNESQDISNRKLQRVNDGDFSTESWIARVEKKGSNERPWIQFTFTEPNEISRIALSTNRSASLETDYLVDKNDFNFETYSVEVLDEKGEWKQIASIPGIRDKNKRMKPRADAIKAIQSNIDLLAEEGPKPSFIANFVEPVETRVFHRGSPETPRDVVYPSGLTELNGDLKLDSNASGKKRRVTFAKWLTDPKNPLTARVEANRLWHHIFGQGIVATTSDFGAAGAMPSHPELLEWLASELMAPTTLSNYKPQAWSMKHMIRLMVMSDAFRQSSLPSDKGLAVDADSALLWRFPPRRMEAEVIRDSILQASGLLDDSIGGRSYRIHNVKKRYAQWVVTDNHGPHTWRRMIYQERMRRVDDQMFTAFDFPDCGQVRPKRPVSTTPLQALNLLNSDFVIDQSQQIAKRAKEESKGNHETEINRSFQLLLGRTPTESELATCLEMIKQYDLAIICRAIMNSNEFTFLP